MRIPFSLLLSVALLLSAGGCSGKKETNAGRKNVREEKQAAVKKPTAGGMENVCKYFPKELVEKATGKPIVKVEVSILGSELCSYYTSYSQKYHHTPYGDDPGGPHVVAVYDYKDFAKDRVTNEKHGDTYTSDPAIGMDNYVVRSRTGKIWQAVLVLGGEKYIRIKAVDNAVTGEDLVKIAGEFARKIKR